MATTGTGHGIFGISASTPKTSAPSSAIRVITIEPGTQSTATVELATAMVSSSTRTKAGKLPWGRWISGRLSRALGQTDCIPRPQKPAEVVSLSDDIELNVRPEIQAQLHIRAAEAGR